LIVELARSKSMPSEVRNWIGRQLFDHVPVSIAVIDRQCRIVVANDRFGEVFGKPAGRRCYEAYKRADSVCDGCMAMRTFADGKGRISDEDGMDKQGRVANFVVHHAPVYDEVGEIAYVIKMSYDLTETKSLQREYNAFFEQVPCYVAVINRDLRIVRANELLRDTFGDPVGEHCFEVYKHRRDRCPDCPALKSFADGGSYRSEQVGVNLRGDPTHYVVSTTPMSRNGQDPSHVVEMAVDVTDVHKLSAELMKETAFRHILIENTLDALVAIDAEGVVNIFNRAAEALFKEPADRVIGAVRGERFLPAEFLRAIEDGTISLSLAETRVADASGRVIPVRFSGSELRDGDRRIGAAAFFQDLREVKRLEREKLENERLAAVGQTVAQLAHGIKNILTGLRGGMYGIKSGIKSGSEQRLDKGWEMLDRNVDRMTVLVRGFLDYSKQYVLDVQPTSPREVAREVYALYRDTAGKDGIELMLEAAEDMPVANLDPSAIHTCLANLVSNGIDACRADGASGGRVSLTVSEQDGAVVFEIADTGCGMEPEVRDKVFNSFFTTKGLAGTGLGLLVTRKLVQEHGGSIAVESEPGQGARFRMVFPRDRLPAHEPGG
jgi:PAS domain S-box-containing protein